MKAALLPDRGVVKVAGDDARKFLNGLVTSDIAKVTPAQAALCRAADAAGQDHRRFHRGRGAARRRRRLLPRLPARARAGAGAAAQFLQAARQGRSSRTCPRSLGVLAIWDGAARHRIRPVLSRPAPAGAGAALHAAAASGRQGRGRPRRGAASTPPAYEAHRIALGVPRGGLDFIYGDAFPHETDMDQLGGVDFDKGCFVGQEVVSRIEHRGTARTRVVPVTLRRLCARGRHAGERRRQGRRHAGLVGATAAALPCCASIASPTRSPPASR